MIKKIIYLLMIITLSNGCATLSTSKMVETTKSQGVEHIFNHPYKNVFYACEDALAERVGDWVIEKSDIESGIIKADFIYRKMIIIVEKLENEKILVKMQKFGIVAGNYERFFKDVERLASRDYYN